ncbi:hypothetical protein LRY29_01585, partial [Candidatus Saccharibacteria bacterium]|nr:hypothetical protein [Candidatus Saccharibacteria bacterium]
MAIPETHLGDKLHDLQTQMDLLRREFDVFRSYVNRNFEQLYERLDQMATRKEVGDVALRVEEVYR